MIRSEGDNGRRGGSSLLTSKIPSSESILRVKSRVGSRRDENYFPQT